MGPLKHWVLFLHVDIRTTAKLFSLSEAIEKDEHDRKGGAEGEGDTATAEG